jgi:hypothetical protein
MIPPPGASGIFLDTCPASEIPLTMSSKPEVGASRQGTMIAKKDNAGRFGFLDYL